MLGELSELSKTRPGPDRPKKEHLAHAAKQLKVYRELFQVDRSDDRPLWLTAQADAFYSLFLNDHIEAEFAKTELGKIRKLSASEQGAEVVLPAIDQRALFVSFNERRRPLGENPDPAQLAEFEEWWQTAREGFVSNYPEQGESATFLIDMALEAEQRNELPKATGYYRQIAQSFPGTQLARKAAGALRRLDLEGKSLEFRLPLRGGGTITDSDTRGKVTLLTFWNVDCQPCQQNLPVLKDLYRRYGKELEIVAVNVDEGPNAIAQYVKENDVPFPVAFEPGGFNGPAATYFGVVNLPTMLLADRQGRVVAVNPDIREVQTKVPQLVK